MYKVLNKQEIIEIKSTIPSYQHYYNNINYNKVDSLYCYAVPYGIKCLAWFTYYNNEPTCFFIELRHNKINKIILRPVSFSKYLAQNTMLYGVFTNNNFIVENIFYYKGTDLKHKDNKYKLNLYNDLFKYHINNKILLPGQIQFSLPIIKKYNSFYNQASHVPYKIYGICYVQNKDFLLKKYKGTNVSNKVFYVKADKINDIYLLYTKEKKFYDIALVISIKLSKYLNHMFRKIKENINLDLLEESDDEDIFENVSSDKFLKTDDFIPMICYYENKLQKWVPFKKINKDANVVSYDKLNKLYSS